MSRGETMVRMGELAVSRGPDDVLTSIGLGSCIGLALVDVDRQVAGLAHVMLPARPEGTADAAVGKFADTAAPALLDAVLRAGARRARLATYVVGGAQMFTFGGRGMDVGTRNDRAVRDAIAALGLRLKAGETGGTKGRTMRVHAADGRVTYKASGGEETALSPVPPRRAAAPATDLPRSPATSRPRPSPGAPGPARPSDAVRPGARPAAVATPRPLRGV